MSEQITATDSENCKKICQAMWVPGTSQILFLFFTINPLKYYFGRPVRPERINQGGNESQNCRKHRGQKTKLKEGSCREEEWPSPRIWIYPSKCTDTSHQDLPKLSHISRTLNVGNICILILINNIRNKIKLTWQGARLLDKATFPFLLSPWFLPHTQVLSTQNTWEQLKFSFIAKIHLLKWKN